MAELKLRECREGRHGACPGLRSLTTYDDATAEVVWQDAQECACRCHVTPIPDPEPTEVTYES